MSTNSVMGTNGTGKRNRSWPEALKRARLRSRTIAWRRHHGAGPGQGQDRHRGDVGFTCATIARSAAPCRRRRCSITRATAPASIPRRISPTYAGIFQADAYGGYNKLYELDRNPGPILEAACWVHARRPFFIMADVAENAHRKAQGKTPAPISPLALEAVCRIDALFEIERSINDQSAEQRPSCRSTIDCPSSRNASADRACPPRGSRMGLPTPAWSHAC